MVRLIQKGIKLTKSVSVVVFPYVVYTLHSVSVFILYPFKGSQSCEPLVSSAFLRREVQFCIFIRAY